MIVFHPGSHSLRFGKASDRSPLVLPHVIGRRVQNTTHTSTVPCPISFIHIKVLLRLSSFTENKLLERYGSAGSRTEGYSQRSSSFSKTPGWRCKCSLPNFCSWSLQKGERFDKTNCTEVLKYPTPKSSLPLPPPTPILVILNLVKWDGGFGFFLDWCFSCAKILGWVGGKYRTISPSFLLFSFLICKIKALRIANEKREYTLYYPIRRGRLNVSPTYPLQAVLGDIYSIWSHALSLLGIEKKVFEDGEEKLSNLHHNRILHSTPLCWLFQIFLIDEM